MSTDKKHKNSAKSVMLAETLSVSTAENEIVSRAKLIYKASVYSDRSISTMHSSFEELDVVSSSNIQNLSQHGGEIV